MVTPWVLYQLVCLYLPVPRAKDVVDAEPSAHGLETTGPLLGGFQEGILHAERQLTVGVGTRSVIEITTYEGGDSTGINLSF